MYNYITLFVILSSFDKIKVNTFHLTSDINACIMNLFRQKLFNYFSLEHFGYKLLSYLFVTLKTDKGNVIIELYPESI